MDERTIRRNVQDLLNASGSLKANFVVIAGLDIGRKFPIQKSELSIGRGDACDIYVNDDDVSRNHAKVVVEPSGIFIVDLGSTNGTLINGNKVAKHLLTDGDRIQIGNMTVLKFNFFNELEDSYNEQLYMAANKDYLTQTYNKKYFLDRLRMELSHSRRHNTPLSIILIDVDLFKNLNDKHGHIAGDAILKELAKQISSIKREEDLFARFGGEEFILMLRETTQNNAIQIAEKIRSYVENLEFNIDEKTLKITLSLGVATFTDNNFSSAEDLIRQADTYLYMAKNKGRNLVIHAA